MKDIKSEIRKRVPVGRLLGARERVSNAVHSALSPFLRFAPAGHFYSPLPSREDIEARAPRLFDRDVTSIPGVDLRDDAQRALLKTFAGYADEVRFPDVPSEGFRYHLRNPFFGHGDATILACMLRHHVPTHVIEVGSGFSSAVMLDVNEKLLGKSMKLTFIEPWPERLLRLLDARDRRSAEIVEKNVQVVELDRFRALEDGDMLFIDSSHVAKIGSDVCHLLFEVLPVLASGVFVHFHDVLWPFEYPREWLEEGRAWNEAYMLRAFLQYNHAFEIVYFNSYMGHRHRDLVRECLPVCLENPGGSLWLRKK